VGKAELLIEKGPDYGRLKTIFCFRKPVEKKYCKNIILNRVKN
jgi:hypothetical protein